VRATLAAVTRRMTGSQERRCPNVWAGCFLLAAVLFLAPARTIAAVSVTISPSSVNLPANGSQQFTAIVTGASDTSVTWTIQEGASGGTISGSGLYAAPGVGGVYHVLATSNADNTQSATAAVAVPGFVQTGLLNPSPCTATLLTNGTVLYTGGGTPASGYLTSPAEVYNPATSTSAATGSMTILRCSETSTLLPNGKVLFAGGLTSGGSTASAELYDPIAGSFTATGSMSVARQDPTATLLPNGTVLIAGGVGNCGGSPCFYNTAELYDPNSGTFKLTTGTLLVAALNSTSTLLPRGMVLLAGGSTGGSNVTATAELYNPATGLFTQTGTMINARGEGFTATLLQNGNVLFAGGLVGGAVTSAAEIYDPSTGTFAATGNLNIPRDYPSAALLPNGQVLIVGGNSTLSRPAAAELYDPGSGTFSLTSNLSETRVSPAATALPNGMVLIAGGGSIEALGSVETYDPSSGVFTSKSVFLNVPRTGHSTTQLADGRLLLVGGQDAYRNVTSSAEIYDPATGKFSLTGSLIQGRFAHTATLLGNGNVLIVGGFGSTGATSPVTVAELYNSVSGTFSPTSSPNVARAYHTATLLPNGLVLIAGGLLATQQATASVELYNPVAETFTLAGNMDAPRFNHTATLLNDGQVLIAEGITVAGNPSLGVGPDDLYDPSSGLFTQVGPQEQWNLPNYSVLPFDSVRLASGQVLVDNQTIFDPTSNTLSTITSSLNLNAILQDYKFALLPNNQVFATSENNPTYLFDPTTEIYTPSAPMEYLRIGPTVKLLANGEVLVAGGAGIAQVEFYVPPVAPSNSSPVLVSVNPSSAVAGGAGFTLIVNGINFVNNSVVNFNGVARQTTFNSNMQLSISISPTDIANPGAATISVTNPASGAGGSTTSNAVTLTIMAANLQPVVGSLVPASATAGGPAFTLSLSGNNFTPSSVVTFNGNTVPSTYSGVTELQANIPASAITVAGTPIVAVANPGSHPSTVVTFTVNNPVPQESLISPSSAAAGSAALTLDVVGTNFNSSSSVLVNGAALTTTYVSSTLLQAALPASDLTQGGTLNVSVNNPTPGGGTTSALTFTVADYTVTAPTPSATVNAGHPAIFNLTIAPSNGTYANPITFTAKGLPAGATASFGPSATITPGATSQTETLTITTAPHTATSEYYFTLRNPPVLVLLCLVGMALAFAGLALRTAARRVRRLAPQYLLAFLLVACAGLAACAGGGASSSTQPNPATGTPAGTYTIQVIATSGEVSHFTTVTLTVM
jgi:hypothetical protein